MIKEEVCVSCSALPLLFHPTSRVLGFVNEREGGNLARESERRQGKLSLCTNLFQVPQGFFTPPPPQLKSLAGIWEGQARAQTGSVLFAKDFQCW